MSAIIIDDEIVHYEVLGRGPAILLVHGWVGSWRYWIPTMQALSVKYRTYAIDLWGFGDTSKRAERYTLERQIELVDKFLDQLGILKTALVGHALGGAVVLRFAGRRPDSVARVMAVNVPLVGAAVNPRLSGTPVPALVETLFGRGPDSEPISVEANKADAPAVEQSIRGLMETDLRPDLLQVRAPCLLVHGDKDPIVAPPQDGWVSGLNLNLHRINFEESRHFPMLDEAAKFNRLLLDFLEASDIMSLQLKDEWRRRMR